MNNPFNAHRSLVFAAMLGTTAIAISPACAFNPQPDPPAKILKGIDWGDGKFNRNNANNTGAFGRARNSSIDDPNLRYFIEDPNLKGAKSRGAIGSVTPGASPGLLGGARFGGAGIR
jgi:hypothetical protein